MHITQDGWEVSAETVSPVGKATSTRIAAILDAAETIFAAGFAGASMREIAERAGVAQALIHYHFDTKEKLFEAVVARRTEEINGARAEMLDTLFVVCGTPQLEDVMDALFRPAILAGRDDGRGFSRIVAAIANSEEARDKALVQRYHDPIAKKFIDAIMLTTPGLEREEALWAYDFAVSVGMAMMARDGHGRHSEGTRDDTDVEAMLTRMVPFVCAGVRALAAGGEAGA